MRTVFVSDIHLGCRHSQATAFLKFLNSIEPRQLYLVGDFIDGWKLRRQWRWNSVYSKILLRLCEMAHGGTRIYFTPGNHDDFLREPVIREVVSMGVVKIRDEFIHHTADGRRFMVLHGDRFDSIETGARWVSVLATIAYDSLLAANALVSRMRGTKVRHQYSLGATVKRSVKQIVKFISEFESRLIAHAEENGCAGVICGHIHTPTMMARDGMMYLNSGDWVENCTAIIEEESGHLELVQCHDESPEGWVTIAVSPCHSERMNISASARDVCNDKFATPVLAD